MEAEDRERMVRVEEGVKYIKESLPHLAKKVEKHEADLGKIKFLGAMFALFGTWFFGSKH